MPIIYTAHDLQVTQSIKFKIRDEPEFADSISSLSEFIGKDFPFQFPPRVRGDSKSAEWTEKSTKSYEPTAFFAGASPRKLTVEATYVVDGGQWPGSKIAKLAHAAKAYFYRSIENTAEGFGPVVEISALYGAIEEQSTWRMTEVGVEYGDEIVNDGASAASGSPTRSSGTGSNSSFWPLVTKISFNLASYTQIQDGDDTSTAKQPVPALSAHPTTKWF